MTYRIFFSPDQVRYVLLTENVLLHMYGYAQKTWYKAEAGGELFSPSPYSSGMLVDTIRGPHRQDRRRRRSYNPSAKAATQARNSEYERGRHAVGLWHTHPEPLPSPSGTDRTTTEDYLRAFNGDRKQYLSIIIGNRGEKPALTVWSAETDGNWLCWSECHEQQDRFPGTTRSTINKYGDSSGLPK